MSNLIFKTQELITDGNFSSAGITPWSIKAINAGLNVWFGRGAQQCYPVDTGVSTLVPEMPREHYAYSKQNSTITLVEFYHKSQQTRENRARILKYFYSSG